MRTPEGGVEGEGVGSGEGRCGCKIEMFNCTYNVNMVFI